MSEEKLFFEQSLKQFLENINKIDFSMGNSKSKLQSELDIVDKSFVDKFNAKEVKQIQTSLKNKQEPLNLQEENYFKKSTFIADSEFLSYHKEIGRHIQKNSKSQNNYIDPQEISQQINQDFFLNNRNLLNQNANTNFYLNNENFQIPKQNSQDLLDFTNQGSLEQLANSENLQQMIPEFMQNQQLKQTRIFDQEAQKKYGFKLSNNLANLGGYEDTLAEMQQKLSAENNENQQQKQIDLPQQIQQMNIKQLNQQTYSITDKSKNLRLQREKLIY